MWSQLLLLSLMVIAARGFGNQDRFLKKYALLKIFESCFGQNVLKEIRDELKAASAKCAILDVPPTVSPPPSTSRPISQHKIDITEPEKSDYPNQQDLPPESVPQAILAFRPNSYPAYRPFAGSPGSFYQAFANPGPFYGANYPSGTFFPSPYSLPIISQPYLGSARMSRGMDFHNQLDMLSTNLSGKVKNVTCVMQDLGYLDENLEPNYQKISKRLGNMPVEKELRRDMQDGVSYCQQFSQCIPDPKKSSSPHSRELNKSALFFKCYKYKKLEACILKDAKEKLSNITEEDFDDESTVRRSGKILEHEEEIDELAASLYEFLYGADANFDMDTFI